MVTEVHTTQTASSPTIATSEICHEYRGSYAGTSRPSAGRHPLLIPLTRPLICFVPDLDRFWPSCAVAVTRVLCCIRSLHRWGIHDGQRREATRRRCSASEELETLGPLPQ